MWESVITDWGIRLVFLPLLCRPLPSFTQDRLSVPVVATNLNPLSRPPSHRCLLALPSSFSIVPQLQLDNARTQLNIYIAPLLPHLASSHFCLVPPCRISCKARQITDIYYLLHSFRPLSSHASSNNTPEASHFLPQAFQREGMCACFNR